MAKLIAKRYEILNEVPSDTRGFRRCLAQDQPWADGPTVQLMIYPRSKHSDLVHSMFESRAKELKQLNHPKLQRLVDYDYDGPAAAYYLVFQHDPGKRSLALYLKAETASFDWAVRVLLEVCESLNCLHSRGLTYGELDYSKVHLEPPGQLPLLLTEPGLRSIELLLASSDVVDDDPVQRDIAGLGKLAAQMLTRAPNPTERQIQAASVGLPQAMHDVVNRALSTQDGRRYQSVAEVVRDLCFARSQNAAKTKYYLEITRTAAIQLSDMGFITDGEAHLAVPLLNEELCGEVYGIADPMGGAQYSLITPRFRLRCVPAWDAPDQHLAIRSAECPNATRIAAERERGLRITASLVVTSSGQTPQKADVTPLLDALEKHRLEAQTKRRSELAQKSSLETWTKVLDLQRRLLNEFELPYSNWELVDGGSALRVELTQARDALELKGEERLCMSPSAGHNPTLAGFFEEVAGKDLKIGLARGAVPDAIAKTGKITLDNSQLRSILTRQEDAFRRLKFGESVNPLLYRVLTDPTTLDLDHISARHFWDQDLDAPQQDVVRKALATRDIFLVHGPPGTGKTTTIVEIVRQILHSDQHAQRVLIASQSNVAVNHALATLLKAEPGLSEAVVRVGREEKAGETAELLLDHQLVRWADQVNARSRAYLDDMRRKLAVDSRLAECVTLLDEHETEQSQRERIEQERKAVQSEYDGLGLQLLQLEALLAVLQGHRQRLSALAAATTAGDASLTQLLEAFQTDYLNWGEHFLGQASEAARLGMRRVELLDTLDQLKATHTDLEERLSAGTASVREALRDLYQVDLADAVAQRMYIEQNLAEQHAMALKLGRIQKLAQDWSGRLRGDVTDFTSAYLSRSRVIGATCIGIAAKGDINDVDFDWVIVDEAGRATHPELVVPLVRGRKLILVGDHRQLPPIVDRELKDELLEEIGISRQNLSTSLFQDLMERAPEAVTGKLLVQYRMHPAIGNLVGGCFYGGDLQNGRTAEERQHGLTWCPAPVVWYSTHRLKHHEEHQEAHIFQNNSEVEVVLKLLDRIEADLAPRNLTKKTGIITGYLGQKRLLQQRIPEGTSPRWPHVMVEVNTVDAYQGREMDYIIYSVVRSNPERQIGFLSDERRLNVAFSRARELLIVVGDREHAETAKTRGYPNPFVDVLQHIRTNRSECRIEDLTQ